MSSTALKIIKANYDARQAVLGEIRSVDDKVISEDRSYNPDEQTAVDELRTKLEGIDARIQANLTQEIRSAEIADSTAAMLGLLAGRDGDMHDERSLGERFVSDDELRSWMDSGARGKAGLYDQSLDVRAVTDTTTAATSAGALSPAVRLSRVGQDFLDRRVYLMDMLPSIQVSSGSVEIVRDESPLADLANKATEVAEGAAKPQAGITMDVVSEPVATIAAHANMTRQAASDYPAVRGYLDGRLRYTLKRRGDGQVINGGGTGANLTGLANRSGIVTYAPAGAEARYKSIRHAVRLGEDAEAAYEIIVLNPADAELFDLSNDTSNGLHAVPNVAGPGARTAWGLTQVRSTAIASGTALLIDPMAVSILDRQQVSAYMTDSHASNFTSNILTLLLEMRMGLALFDPSGVAKVTFNGTT